MTIIKPDRDQSYLFFLVLLGVLVLAGGLFYIFQYNAVVSARHQLKELKSGIVEAEIASADLKNSLYQIIDPANLEALASENNLVLEQQPEYLYSQRWVSDSSL